MVYPRCSRLTPMVPGRLSQCLEWGSTARVPSTLLPGSADPGLPVPGLLGVVQWVLGLTGAACQAQLPWPGALPPSGASELWKLAGYRA